MNNTTETALIRVPVKNLVLSPLNVRNSSFIFLLRYLLHPPLQCDFDSTSLLEDDFSGEPQPREPRHFVYSQ